MTGIAARFFGSAIVYAILAMSLGLFMGITHDHTQMPTHAHFMLIGWVTFAIFAVFYHLFPAAAARPLAALHFWLAQASFIAMIVGLALMFGGNDDAEPVVAASSIAMLVSMIVFGLVALPVIRGRP